MTSQWYEKFYKKKNMVDFTSKQIKEFEQKL